MEQIRLMRKLMGLPAIDELWVMHHRDVAIGLGIPEEEFWFMLPRDFLVAAEAAFARQCWVAASRCQYPN
jgi:hypothetical protein